MIMYAISGLDADERVFQNLNLSIKIIHIKWIAIEPKDTIETYTNRIAKLINTSEDFGILGLSFGGLIAVEVSKILNPKFTILLSSVEVKSELPALFRIVGKTRMLHLIPSYFFRLPISIACWLFGTKNKTLLKNIINDADLVFYKWAINQITTWKNEQRINCLKIVGEKDKLLPPTNDEKSSLVKGGAHFMVLDKANEISKIIKNYLKEQA